MEQWAGRMHENSFQKCKWDAHVIPQIEYLRGHDLKHIRCIHQIDKMLKAMNTSSSISSDHGFQGKNACGHSSIMPYVHFQSPDLLANRTRRLLEIVYAEDIKLYESFCL